MKAQPVNPSSMPVIMLQGSFGVPWTSSARGSSSWGRMFPMSPCASETTIFNAPASEAPATAAFASWVMSCLAQA
jgi:hypothetical protein